MKYFLLVFLSSISFFISLGCDSKMNNTDIRKKYYFTGFSGYSIPLKLTGKIKKEDITIGQSYYIGTYDDEDRLIKVEKFFKDKLFFIHQYIYYSNGIIKESRVINANGEESVSLFNEKGEKIKDVNQ